MKKRKRIGTRIKRTIIFLLILAAAGSVFYFGYFQFQLPADTYGVIFTKYTSDGWDHNVVRPAEFRFEWQGLIPTNLSLHKFRLKPVINRITIDGKLPSSEIYNMYLEGRPDFSYSYSFDVSYTLRPDSLVSLAADEFLREDNLDDLLSDLESTITADAVAFLRTIVDDASAMKRISYNYRLIEPDLIEYLSEKHNFIDIISFIPVDISFPDLALYEEGRRQYFEAEKYHNDIQNAATKETASRLVEESAKLELLEKYGALFEKYPSLIDYYSIFSEEGSDMIPSIELPELEGSGAAPAAGSQLLRGSN